MLVVLFVWLAAAGFAQTGQDALPLLRDVAGASRGLTTYRADGHIVQDLDIGLGGGKRDLVFHLASRSRRQMRIEVAGGPEWMTGLPYTAICNGRDGWVYYDKGKNYRKVVAGDFTEGYCTPGTLTSFEHVADDVKSAVVTGVSSARFAGRSQPCVEVQAQYRVIKDLMIPPGIVTQIGQVSRRMCIDRGRKLILRDRFEADVDAGPERYHILETVTYDRIERNPDLPATLFDFQPPDGATLFKDPEPAPDVASPPPAALSHVHALPSPVAREEPEYSQEAWDEGIQGKVILLPDIDPDGTVRDVKVRQSLGYGLDEKAIESVRKWRFSPATDDGKPVKGTAWVEICFSLPDKRPERPSPTRVSKPVPPPRLPSVELEAPTELDHFHYVVALNFKAAEACQKIHPLADGGGAALAERGYQIQSLRSKCYDEVATMLHDAKLCDYVKPVKTEVFDGSKFDRAYCLTHLHGPSSVAVPDPLNMEPFVRRMRTLGYDDGQIADFRHGQSPYNNDTYAAYRKLRAEPAFLDRVHAAPSYAEARSRAKIRPAHAAEFLYQMVAIDTQDAGLCAKVSPNATFVDGGGRTALIRSQCYVALAYNMRDAALCGQLPSAGAFPYVNNVYDSRETCRETVAVYSRPDFKAGGLHDGPALFPHPSYFEKALLQIGFTKPYAATLVSKPTPDDYWDFLSNLSLRGSAQDRDEFLRRVMSLK